jgi:hypothetical protein
MQTYRATVTIPTANGDTAVVALRQQMLRLSQAERGMEVPDWPTMRVQGPEEVYGRRGEILFEYRGTVRGRSIAERRAGRA